MEDLQKEYELIIIGGGINGTGIARDAALRGIKTLLIEKEDFASGATGACSGMIHGGVRYLESDRAITELSCTDSGYIQKIGGHLIFRIPFLYPLLKNDEKSFGISKNGLLFELMETYFTAYDKFQPLKNGKKHTRLTPEETLALHPGINPNIHGSITFDEYGINPFRLSIANALAAKEAGADVLNHTEVTNLIIEDGKAIGIEIFNSLSKTKKVVLGKHIINATGPWSHRFASKYNLSVKLRPAKGIHLVYGRRLSNYAVGSFAIDGRSVFIMPHENSTIIGTTDDDYYGDPGDLSVTDDEVEYLLEAIEKVIPDIREHRIIRAFAGVRPTIWGDGVMEDNLTRDHEIIDHGEVDNVKNIYSLIGGKLAAFRFISEEIVDMIADKLGNARKSITHSKPLPGAEYVPNIERLAEESGLSFHTLNRLMSKYGSRVVKIISIIDADPQSKEIVCKCENVMEAEIKYAIQYEFANTLNDIRKRTRLGMGSCQGGCCTLKAARILKNEFSFTTKKTEEEAKHFLQKRYNGHVTTIKNTYSLQQLELNMANHKLIANLKGEN